MFLDLLFDIILLIILVGVSYYGYKKGFFRFAIGTVKGVLCFAISIILCEKVGDVIIVPLIRDPIKGYLLTFFQERLSYNYNTDSNRMPTLLKIAGVLFDERNEDMGLDTAVEELVNRFSDPLISLISRLIAFVLLFIIVKFLIKIIIFLSDCIFTIGVIGKLNQFFGGFVSICMAFFFACIFTSFIEYIFHFDVFANSPIVMNFKGGFLYRFFAQFSFIRLLLSF